jgi:hypothetical protein
MRSGPAVAIAALVSLLCVAGGSNAAPTLEGQTATSRWFRLPAGPTSRTFTMRRPHGIVRLARITTTRGIQASVEATAGPLMAVSLNNDRRRDDPARTCRRNGDVEVCTQAIEGCPAPAAVWSVHLEKLGGPAGLVRFEFVISA